MESGAGRRKRHRRHSEPLAHAKLQPRPGRLGFPPGWRKVARNLPRILAADDQQHILQAIELLLKPQGYEVDVVRSPELAREALASSSYDAVLIDLNYTRDTTSGQEGLDLLSDIVAMDGTLPVIVMTAWGNVDLAVEAMRRGARDFIQKPWENERLLAILRSQVELHRALQRAERLAAENRLLSVQGRPEFIATAPSMVPVLEAITRVRSVRRECADQRRAWDWEGSSCPDDPCAYRCGLRVNWWR